MLLEIGRKVRDAFPISLIRFSPLHEDAQFLGKQQETSYLYESDDCPVQGGPSGIYTGNESMLYVVREMSY